MTNALDPLALAIADRENGRYAEAAARLTGYLASNPDDAGALAHLAHTQLLRKQDSVAHATLARAEALAPELPVVLRNRARLALKAHKIDDAAATIARAFLLDSTNRETRLIRAAVLAAKDDAATAMQMLDTLLAECPHYAEALITRAFLHMRGQNPAAATADARRAADIKPHLSQAWRLLAALHTQGQRAEDALSALQRYCDLEPEDVTALTAVGEMLRQRGRTGEALVVLARAVDLKPDLVAAWINYGAALQQVKRTDEAKTAYTKALDIDPNLAEVANNLGAIFIDEENWSEAVSQFERALTLKPDHSEARMNLGVVLKNQGKLDEAITHFEQALRLKPTYAEAFNNQGNALRQVRRLDEALASYDRAVALKPDFAEAFNNRGIVLKDLKRLDEALASFERALALDPDYFHAFAGAADCSLALCDWKRTARIEAEFPDGIAAKRPIVLPFTLLGYSGDPALQRMCAENIVRESSPVLPKPVQRRPNERTKKIRIGYLSAKFNSHAGAMLIAELIEIHDRSRFEVVGLSLGHDDRSNMRARLVRGFDAFHDLRGMSDQQAAEHLSMLAVDIAVDLTGHNTDARPGILARRPALVQVNWLGYPGTLGEDFIDYVIADPIVLPLDQQPHYVEKIVHLPDCYQVNDRQRIISDRVPSRGDVGLPDAGFVFCSFNNNYKITAPVFDVWMRLLRAVEGSVVWLLRDNPGAERNLRREADARSVDPARLVFADRVAPADHLARHRLADLFLDTLPYNAHVTASDALWAGLPIVTCCGSAFAGRVAASLLHAAGLPELVTHNLDDYEGLALTLARNPGALGCLRRKLQDNRRECRLFDTNRFRCDLEAAYATMWEIAVRGKPPRSFKVGPAPRRDA